MDPLVHDADYLRVMRGLAIASVIIAPLVAHDRTFGAIALVRTDPSRRFGHAKLEAAIELGRRAGYAIENAQLYREARDATRAREETLAIVSHDLRSPLGAIDLAAAAVLESGEVAPSTARHLETIQRSASRMDHLLRDLLAASSLQAGRLRLERTTEDVAALVAGVVDAYGELARRQGIELADDCVVNGAQLHGDRSRLMQAFGNLVGNALKFCSRGDVVTIRARVVDHHVRFEVADTGPGIADDDLPHVLVRRAQRHEGHRPRALHLQGDRRGPRRDDLGRQQARPRLDVRADDSAG